MKRNSIYAGMLAVLLLGLLYACRKEFSDPLTSKEALNNPDADLTIDLSKEYFFNVLGKKQGYEVKSLNPSISSATKNYKHVMWAKAYEGETPTHTYVEVPVVYNRRSVSFIKRKGYKKDPDTEQKIFTLSFDRLVIYKNKETGVIDQRIISYVPDAEYLKKYPKTISHNRIDKLDKHFSGNLIYKKWDGTPLFALKIKNGKARSRLVYNQSQKNPKGHKNKVSYEVCDYVTVEVWEQQCDDPDPEAEVVVGYGTVRNCVWILISSEGHWECHDEEDYDNGDDEEDDDEDNTYYTPSCFETGACTSGGSGGGVSEAPLNEFAGYLGLTTAQRDFISQHANSFYSLKYFYSFGSNSLTVEERANIIRIHIEKMRTDPEYLAFELAFQATNISGMGNWWEVSHYFEGEWLDDATNLNIAVSRNYFSALGVYHISQVTLPTLLDTTGLSPYPKFKEIVTNLPAFLNAYPNVKKALAHFTGFTEAQVMSKMQPGVGPKVKVVDIPDRFQGEVYGHYDAATKTLEINAKWVRGLEAAQLSKTIEATALLLAITAFHEFVHYGRDFNNLTNKFYHPTTGIVYEPGNYFEWSIHPDFIGINKYTAIKWITFFPFNF